jgi:hypothetical protein
LFERLNLIKTIDMKKGRLITGLILGLMVSMAYGQELLPDQNPNYMNAAQKYAAQSAELTATQSTTVHDTYEAYDWREAKAEARALRLQRRHEIRTLRYMRPNGFGYYNRPFRGYGFNNWYGYGYKSTL